MSATRRKLLLCVRNDGYEASLERLKIYQALPDRDAAKHQQVRVIDESGEDYLYPARFFAPIDGPVPRGTPTPGAPPIVGTLYVAKWYAGDAQRLTVTIARKA